MSRPTRLALAIANAAAGVALVVLRAADAAVCAWTEATRGEDEP